MSIAKPSAAPGTRSFGTHLLLTEIEPTADGFAWTRRPGDLAPEPFVSAGTAHSLLPPQPADEVVQLRPGRVDGEAREYRVSSNHSLASDLLESPGSTDLSRLLPAFTSLGTALRRLHAHPVEPTAGLTRPRPLNRLLTWLTVDDESSRLAYLKSRLDGPLRARLIEVAARASIRDLVLAHGAASLGAVVGPDANGGYVLLTGEDICLAHRLYDLGFIVGELAEMAWQLGWHPSAWSPLVHALSDGYGTDESVTSWSALRMAIHAHDIAAYTAVDQSVLDPYAWWIGQLLTPRSR